MLKSVQLIQKPSPFFSNSFQALAEDEDTVGESMQKYEAPVESLNMITKKRFCIAKCACCQPISIDSEDFEENFDEVAWKGGQQNHTKSISKSNISSFESTKKYEFSKNKSCKIIQTCSTA